MFMDKTFKAFFFTSVLVLLSPSLAGFFVDGSGHYAIRAQQRTAQEKKGTTREERGFLQSLRLNAELRKSEKTNYTLDLTLFEDPATSSLGDQAQADSCLKDDGSEGKRSECLGKQDVSSPQYKPYQLIVRQAVLSYASDYCVLNFGRRARGWGLGILLDAGDAPFSRQQSLFDGISCNVIMQKSQNIGISVGWDKLRESGQASQGFVGFGKEDDDIDQYYFTLELDERRTNPAGVFILKPFGSRIE